MQRPRGPKSGAREMSFRSTACRSARALAALGCFVVCPFALGAEKMALSLEHIADVPLGWPYDAPGLRVPGSRGNTQYDPSLRHIFANVQTLGRLAEIDPISDTVIGHIDLTGADGNDGLLIEPLLHLALVACEGNDRLFVMDLKTRSVVNSFDHIKDPDVLASDPDLSLLYVAGESPLVFVFRLAAGGVSEIPGGLPGPSAHVVSVDPATHYTYFPLLNVDGRTVLRVMRSVP
jgi:hypothetical protein